MIDSVMATNQALKGYGHMDPTAKGEDWLVWMPQPFCGTLQGHLLLSESCGIGQTLCARGPHLCQVWEAELSYAEAMITKEGRFGKDNDVQLLKKTISSTLGVHHGGSALLLMEQGPHLCCCAWPG